MANQQQLLTDPMSVWTEKLAVDSAAPDTAPYCCAVYCMQCLHRNTAAKVCCKTAYVLHVTLLQQTAVLLVGMRSVRTMWDLLLQVNLEEL